MQSMGRARRGIILSVFSLLSSSSDPFLVQGSAKLEKAEILQMTVDHLRHLHQSRDARGKQGATVVADSGVHY